MPVVGEVPVHLQVVRAGDAEDGVDAVRGKGLDDGRAAVAMLGHRLGRQHRQQLVGDVRGGDAGDLGVVVGRGDLDDVGADDVRARPGRAGMCSSSRLVSPPASGVPVPGACAGSSTSMSIET